MQRKKTHSFSLSKVSYRPSKNYELLFGNYGIKSLNFGLITSRHLENMRRKLSKQFKKINKINKSKLFFRANLWKSYTAKPQLSRMGKGAGAICKWRCLIKPGCFLIEILTPELFCTVLKVIKKTAKFFPFKILLIKKRI